MVIKSNDRLAHITSNRANYYYCYTYSQMIDYWLSMLTTPALRDNKYSVY